MTAAANVTGGQDLDPSLWLGVGNAAEAVVAAAVLCCTHGTGSRSSTRCTSSGAWSLAAAPGRRHVRGHRRHRPRGPRRTSPGARLPLVVHLARRVHPGDRPDRDDVSAPSSAARQLRSWEIPVQVVALAVVDARGLRAAPVALDRASLPLPILVWAALRFDLRTVSLGAVRLLRGRDVPQLPRARTDRLRLRPWRAGPGRHEQRRARLPARARRCCRSRSRSWSSSGTGPSTSSAQRAAVPAQLHRVPGRHAAAARRRHNAFEIVDLNESATRLLGGTGSPTGHALGEYLDAREPLRPDPDPDRRAAAWTAGSPSAGCSTGPAPGSTSRSRCSPPSRSRRSRPSSRTSARSTRPAASSRPRRS